LSADRGLLTAYLYDFRAKNPTEKSITIYTERIRYLIRLAQSLNKSVLDVTAEDIKRYCLSELVRLKPVSINGRLKVWRAFYAWIEATGNAPNNGWVNPVAGLAKLKEQRRSYRLVTPEEYSAAIKTYNPRTFTGLRNICLMLVAWDCMLRKTEMLTLKVPDVILEPSRRLLRVLGKGRKEAWLPFSYKTASRLSLYMERRREIDGDLLFCSSKGTAIDERHGHRIFSNAGDKLTPPVDIHPHLVRRSAATDYWKRTGNIYLVSTILRHTSIRVTELYVQAGQAEMIKAYDSVTPAGSLNV
jgi:site-specific recombinase XerC